MTVIIRIKGDYPLLFLIKPL